jgi:hypothetical protein
MQNEWKNKEKRLKLSRGDIYKDLPKLDDPSLVVLEKTVAGFAEAIHEKVFEEHFDDLLAEKQKLIEKRR